MIWTDLEDLMNLTPQIGMLFILGFRSINVLQLSISEKANCVYYAGKNNNLKEILNVVSAQTNALNSR
jgi:hypothetical protein